MVWRVRIAAAGVTYGALFGPKTCLEMTSTMTQNFISLSYAIIS